MTYFFSFSKLPSYLLLVLLLSVSNALFAQPSNDNPCGAITLSLNASCNNTTGTTVSSTTTTGAGYTNPVGTCISNTSTGNTAPKDVWYKITTNASGLGSTSFNVTVEGITLSNVFIVAFSAASTCSSTLTPVTNSCATGSFGSVTTVTSDISGLSPNTTYYIRIASTSTSGTGTFNICATVPPVNDEPCGAINLPSNSTCYPTFGTTSLATQTLAGCTGTADDDVWYKFTAVSTSQTITLAAMGGDPNSATQVFTGTSCSALTAITGTCSTADGGQTVTGLTVGNTYYVRVFTENSGSSREFNICLTHATVTYDIDAYNGQTVYTCSGIFTDSNPGGNYANNENYTVTFCSNTGDYIAFDFSETSTTGYLNLDNADAGDVLTFYAGTSATGTPIASLNVSDAVPFTELQINTLSTCVTVNWVSNGATVDGGWFATVSCEKPPVCSNNPPASDIFGQATQICNLSTYCGSTGTYYGEDLPFNLTGGGGCPNPNDGLFGGTIENNSWLKFIAAATSATFNFTTGNCTSGSGIQVTILGFNGTTFNRVSPCTPTATSQSTSFTVTASGMTVGQTYYIMIDGSAGANCDYTITADPAGVALISAGPDQSICGTSATLAATTAGATGVWSVVSGTGTFANANNANTTVSGLSVGANQLMWRASGICSPDSDIVVINVANPATANAGSAAAICTGSAYSLTGASVGGSASTGAWSITAATGTMTTNASQLSSTAQIATPANVVFTPISGNTGTVTLTLTTNDPTGACTAVTSTVVITIGTGSTVNAGSAASVCSGSALTLSGASVGGAASTGAWSITSTTGTVSSSASQLSSTAQTASPQNVTFTPIAGTSGTATLTLTTDDPAGACTFASSTVVITVNAIPTVSAITGTLTACMGKTTTLSSSTAGGTWSSATPSVATVNASGVVTGVSTGTSVISYTVTTSGCSKTVNATVTVINCPCGITALSATPTACASNLYNVSGSMNLANTPSTGTLIIKIDGNIVQTISSPFGTTASYNVTGLTANGISHTLTAEFSADASCNASVNYNAPSPCVPPFCLISGLTATPTTCSNNLYDISGSMSLSTPPATGTLQIKVDGVIVQTISAPFGAMASYNVTGLAADGASHTVMAVFSADGTCPSTISITAPAACVAGCNANNGTWN
jgi:hypothetical protein